MTEQYYTKDQAAAALGVKAKGLYRIKGIERVRVQNRVIGKNMYNFYLIEDVQKLIEWRQSEEFHRKARHNRVKAGRASNRAQQQPVVTKSGIELKRAQTNDGRQYLVAPALYDVPEPWQWSRGL